MRGVAPFASWCKKGAKKEEEEEGWKRFVSTAT